MSEAARVFSCSKKIEEENKKKHFQAKMVAPIRKSEHVAARNVPVTVQMFFRLLCLLCVQCLILCHLIEIYRSDTHTLGGKNSEMEQAATKIDLTNCTN